MKFVKNYKIIFDQTFITSSSTDAKRKLKREISFLIVLKFIAYFGCSGQCLNSPYDFVFHFWFQFFDNIILQCIACP